MNIPLNEEQQIMAALLVKDGYTPDQANSTIRAEPMLATVLGSSLIPLAKVTAEITRKLADLVDRYPWLADE